MSTRMGMDAGFVRQAAAAIDNIAGELDRLVGRTDGLVATIIDNWHGQDAATFHQAWASRHRNDLSGLGVALHAFAKVATTNANAQDQASDAEARGGTFGFAPIHPPADVFGLPTALLPTLLPTLLPMLLPGLKDAFGIKSIISAITSDEPLYLTRDLPGFLKNIPWMADNVGPFAKYVPLVGSGLSAFSLGNDLVDPKYPGQPAAWNVINDVGDAAGVFPGLGSGISATIHLSEGLVNSDWYQQHVESWWQQNIGTSDDLARGWGYTMNGASYVAGNVVNAVTHPTQAWDALTGDVGRGWHTIFGGN